MEKRFWFGLCLLAVLLAAGLLTAWSMERMHRPGEELLARAESLALSGDMEQAVSLARDAAGQWQKNRKRTACAADHAPMDDVDQLFAELEVYAKAEDAAHFAACCGGLSVLLRAMYDAHSLTFWNLL